MKKIYIILLLLVVSFTTYAQDEAVVTMNEHITKTQADSAYINNDFAGAIAMYEAILQIKANRPIFIIIWVIAIIRWTT